MRPLIWDKSGNAPIYWVGLGVVVLLFATWVAHRQNPASDAPPFSTPALSQPAAAN